VPMNKSRTISLTRSPSQISVGNSEVADILVMRSKELYVLGKQLGTTNVLLWDKDHNLIDTVEVEVTHDLTTLKSKLHQLLPGESVGVYSSKDAIILKGEISSLVKMNMAMDIARSFVKKMVDQEGDKEELKEDDASVINMMSIGGTQQVMLKVTVAEMSRNAMKRMGVKFHAMGIGDDKWSLGGVNGGATFPDALFEPGGNTIPSFGFQNPIIGPVIDEFSPNDLAIGDKGIFASFLSDDFLFRVAVDAAKMNGEAKVLAEPTLTTLSGQEAKFLSGGEFPIPVPDDNGNGITIEFKEFGVGVKFVPVVMDSGQINLKLNIAVSELTSATSLTFSAGNASSSFFVPALTLRSAQSTVVLGDGQTIGIAGLMSESSRNSVDKFPGLGDVPIIGQLFRSQEFQKGETELVMMVTAHLVKPVYGEPKHLPTDEFVEPSDLDFYILGRSLHKPRKDDRQDSTDSDMDGLSTKPTSITQKRGGPESVFGHSLTSRAYQ